MANTVIAIKKSATPSSVPSNLANGELAINYADGKLYYKAANGTIASISGNEPNYFGTVNANNTLVVADTPGDVFTLASGNNIAITGDAINDKITIGLTNDVSLPGTLTLGAVGGDEGGELRLANALTNSVLSGKVVIDIYQNKLRFYEESGTNRGAFIDLAAASGGVATDLLASSGSVDSTARQWATGAFDKANNAYAQANAAYDAANNAVTDFSPAFIQANTARVHANAAFASANAGQATANVAFDKANTANITADRAWNHANAAFNKANNALANSTGTFNGTLTISSDLIALKNIVFGAAGSAFSPRMYSYDNNGIYFYGANTEHSVLKYNKNLGASLGVGTSNPSWFITAYNDGIISTLDYVNIAAYYGGNTTGHNASRMVFTADSTGTYIDTEFDRDFSIRTGYYQDRIKVTYDGKVGINNSNPSSNLDVKGTLLVSDSAVINGMNVVPTVQAAFNQANTSRDHANSAFTSSNSVNTYSNSTYVKLASPNQTITGDLAVSGNLIVMGNSVAYSVENLIINDSLILLANNNGSDIVDIGFIGHYINATGQNVHTGLYREHENKEYYLFQGYDVEPTYNHIGALSNNMTLAVLNADIKTSNLILGGANAILTIGASFNQANTARDHANAAFDAANNAVTDFSPAFLTANIAYAHANAAFNTANSALPNTSGVSFNGNLTIPGQLTLGSNLNFDTTLSTKIRLSSANALSIFTAQSERVRVQNNGYVGLGGPFELGINYNLDVTSNASGGYTSVGITNYSPSISEGSGTSLILTHPNKPFTPFAEVTLTGKNDLIIHNQGDYDGNKANIIFQTNYTEHMRISNVGNVGIGTTAPSQKLDVNGAMKSAGLYDSSDRLLLIKDSTGTVVWGN